MDKTGPLGRTLHRWKSQAVHALWTLALTALLAGCLGATPPTSTVSGPTPTPTPTLPPPPPLSQAGQELAQAHNRFGFDLLHQVSGLREEIQATSAEPVAQATVSPLPAPARPSAPAENIFFSPLSIALALEMTYNGAGGETAAEMARVLHLEGMTLDQVNQAAQELQDNLRAAAGVELAIANSLWLQQSWRFNPDFVARNRTYYDASVEEVDFRDPAAAERLNRWIAQATRDKIPQLVTPDDLQDVVLLLANAVYFKGAWLEAFDPERTRPWEFRLADGRIKEVPMMTQEEVFPALFTEDFAAVALPYQGERVEMLVFVPEERTALNDLLARLTPTTWEEWLAGFRPERVFVGLPRFKVEFERTLNEDLKALGMATAFDPVRANLLGMLPEDLRSTVQLYISLVKHGAVMEVNEEGTVAAAATVVGVAAESAPPSIIADRPFFVAIRDRHSGAVLFMGAVVDPEPLP